MMLQSRIRQRRRVLRGVAVEMKSVSFTRLKKV
jgi:hypothetical protein